VGREFCFGGFHTHLELTFSQSTVRAVVEQFSSSGNISSVERKARRSFGLGFFVMLGANSESKNSVQPTVGCAPQSADHCVFVTGFAALCAVWFFGL